jgi:hypothetical protein
MAGLPQVRANMSWRLVLRSGDVASRAPNDAHPSRHRLIGNVFFWVVVHVMRLPLRAPPIRVQVSLRRVANGGLSGCHFRRRLLVGVLIPSGFRCRRRLVCGHGMVSWVVSAIVISDVAERTEVAMDGGWRPALAAPCSGCRFRCRYIRSRDAALAAP